MNTNERLIKISETIKELGINPAVHGYTFIREAIELVMDDHNAIYGVTKILYPTIAKKYDTTDKKVERSIRHAIESAFNRDNQDFWQEMFNYSRQAKNGRVTNSEFIATVADYLILRELHGGS